MPVKLDIPEALLADTKRFYLDKAYLIINRIKAAKAEFNALQPILTQLGIIVSTEGEILGEVVESPKENSGINKDYSPKWTWLQKSKYALERQHSLTSYEVADFIKVLEPDVSVELLRRSIPATLSVASTNPSSGIIRVKNSQNEWKYELKK